MFIKLFFRGTINEGWKNWMMAIVLAVMSLGHIQQANAQNVVVDALRNPNEVVGTRYDDLTLDPNKSIKENYAKIDSLMSLHREKNYAQYFIMVEGHYTYGKYKFHNFHIGMIFVKDKDNEEYDSVNQQIVNILTGLYSYSLGKKFPVQDELSECHIVTEVDCEFFYSLSSMSPLHDKIYDKVVETINEIRHTGFPLHRFDDDDELD